MSGNGEKLPPPSSPRKCRVSDATGLSSNTSMDVNRRTNAGSRNDKDLLYFKVEKVTVDDLKKVKVKQVDLNGESLALISYTDKVYAIQEKCPHYGGPLHQGEIEEVPPFGACIRCPWHSWKFSLETGQCVSPKREDKCLKLYPVQVSKDMKEIKVGFESISKSLFNTPP
ncbi:Rieske domain-containing protein [Orchesella cincta]|uniref:Rieske domain-containing protein n=1 Tax=Orchesella cincta TaxID=48709 RepID=A0A1D2MWX8_ORCCI|nr:Rieske domain-containing protein [Orchesella cincta]